MAEISNVTVRLDAVITDEQYLEAMGAVRAASERMDQLETENAKLQKLVKDAWGSGHHDMSCGECDIRDECHTEVERMRRRGTLRFGKCLFERRIEERMRELGIEVDE